MKCGYIRQTWDCGNTREVEEKKKILQEDFAIEMTKTLESEVSTMCNLSKGVEEKGDRKSTRLNSSHT